jgi:hypothetical protein
VGEGKKRNQQILLKNIPIKATYRGCVNFDDLLKITAFFILKLDLFVPICEAKMAAGFPIPD